MKTFLLTIAAILMAACAFTPSQIPSNDGPASIVQKNQSYYALFPKRHKMPFHCGANLKFEGRFTPSENLISEKEDKFRELYYKLLVTSAENTHSDSATVAEFPGEYLVVKKVSHQKLVRIRKREYKKTLEWDRQYAGFVNTESDSVLLMNLIYPENDSRKSLGVGWFIYFDAAQEDITTIAYNLSDSSITNDYCGELFPE